MRCTHCWSVMHTFNALWCFFLRLSASIPSFLFICSPCSFGSHWSATGLHLSMQGLAMSRQSGGGRKRKIIESSSDDEPGLENGRAGPSPAAPEDEVVDSDAEDNNSAEEDDVGDAATEDDVKGDDGTEDGSGLDYYLELLHKTTSHPQLGYSIEPGATEEALKGLTGLLKAAPQDAYQLSGPYAAALLLICASHHHGDKEIKVSAALCLAHLLRIHAPTIPLAGNDELKEATKLLIWALGQLTLSSAPTFQPCLEILLLFEQFKLHLLAMDAGSDVLESLFTTLLNITTDENADVTEHTVLEVLCELLEDCDAAHQEDSRRCAGITGDMLASLLSALISGSWGSHRVASALIQRCKSILGTRLLHCCAFLASIVPDAGSLPEALRPVLAELREELEEAEEDRRGAVMDTLHSMQPVPEDGHGDPQQVEENEQGDLQQVQEDEHNDQEMADVDLSGQRQPAHNASHEKAQTTGGSGGVKPTLKPKSKSVKQGSAAKGSNKKATKPSKLKDLKRSAAAKIVQEVILLDGATIEDWDALFHMRAAEKLAQRYAELKDKEPLEPEDVEEVADLLKQGPSVAATYYVSGKPRTYSFYPTPLRMDKDFQLVEGDDDEEEGDTLYGTYEPGRAALLMIRGCTGDCCKGKYQGKPVVLEGIGGELKRWLHQHGVEPWLQLDSLLNRAIVQTGKGGAPASTRTPPPVRKAASADRPGGDTDEDWLPSKVVRPSPKAAGEGPRSAEEAAVEVLVDGFHAEDFSRPARKSAAGAAEARKSRRMVFVSSDEDEDDNHDAEQQEEVWKPIRLEHLRKAGVPGPRKRKARSLAAGQVDPEVTKPASKKQHKEKGRPAPAPAPGDTQPGPAVTPKKVAEDDLLQQLYEAHRELDEAHAAAREASRRLQEAAATLGAAEAKNSQMAEQQLGTSPGTAAHPGGILAENEKACLDAQTELMRADEDAEKADARVQAATGRVAVIMAQLVDGTKAAAAGGSGTPSAGGRPATSSRPAAAVASKGAATPSRSDLRSAPASNPLLEALGSAVVDAEQKQAAAQAADAKAQELRSVADQLAQQAEAAKQEIEALSLTIDKRGLEFKSKRAAMLHKEADAATADLRATEAAEAAETARQVLAAVQQRVAQAQHNIDHAVEHAETAEAQKVSAYDAARAATRGAEERVRELEAQLEQARKRLGESEAAERAALVERVEAARQIRVAWEVKQSQEAAGALAGMREGGEAEEEGGPRAPCAQVAESDSPSTPSPTPSLSAGSGGSGAGGNAAAGTATAPAATDSVGGATSQGAGTKGGAGTVQGGGGAPGAKRDPREWVARMPLAD